MTDFNRQLALQVAGQFLKDVEDNFAAHKDNAGGLVFDINHTLDSHPALDLFGAECRQDGIPVEIITGLPGNKLGYRTTDLLGLGPVDNAEPTPEGVKETGPLYHKPLVPLHVYNCCLYFDDEVALHMFAEMQGGKAFNLLRSRLEKHPELKFPTEQALQFLAAYESLSPEDRRAVRAPLVEAHRARGALLEHAAAPISHKPSEYNDPGNDG